MCYKKSRTHQPAGCCASDDMARRRRRSRCAWCDINTELRDNANEGELHAYLQARGGGSWRSGLRWEQRRISTSRPVGLAMGSGQMGDRCREARARVARGSSLTLAPLTHFVAFGPRFTPGSMLTKKYQSPRYALTFVIVRGHRQSATDTV